MKKPILILATFAFALTGCAQPTSPVLPGAVTVQVLDDEGVPAKGEDVRVNFRSLWQGRLLNKNDVKLGKSDRDGKFYAEGKGDVDIIGMSVGKFSLSGEVGKNDYYQSSCRFTAFDRGNGRWEPWNPEVKLHVRKKSNPVSMFVKKVNPLSERKIPRGEKPNFPDEIAYDLEKGDFCAPQGKGLIRDLIFTVDRSNQEQGVIVKLTFSNSQDGIILLDPQDAANCIPNDGREGFDYIYEFTGPRFAPENGYKDFVWDKLLNRENAYYLPREENNNFYVFRVRSQLDQTGKIKEARYGKIKGGIRFSVREDGFVGVIFTYYYNPDGTRNLEFDPQQNLNRDEETNRGFNEP